MGTDTTWSARPVEDAAYAGALAAAGVDPPIEQTLAWHVLDEADPERETLGRFLVEQGDTPRAVATVTRLVTHHVPFLWVRHGPVWLTTPTPEDEGGAVGALTSTLHSLDPRAVHLRLDVSAPLEGAEPPTGIITYDHTVVIDTSVPDPTAPDEDLAAAILARFKSRGRRDVRKSVRESGLDCADETEAAASDFTPYHALMAETAERDGFIPWPADFYREMVAGLGPDHCRVFAGRLDGELECWSIVTVSGARAARYYAASATRTMRRRVTDRLVLFECVALARRGVTGFDLMGIGSEIAPQLEGLNEFKTKFSTEVTEVPPAREFPLRPLAYRAYRGAREAAALVRRD